MKPLKVVAKLGGPIAMPGHPIALDALLAYAVCLRDGIPPATTPSELVPIEVPLEREPGGRFHLASVGMYDVWAAELKYINKRAPIEQYRKIGSYKIRRVQITAGKNKSYRIPMELLHLVDGAITWYCEGDDAAIESLVAHIHYLGKKRAVGHGKLLRWTVQATEPWDGFPVVKDGSPMRNLPTDWPGLRSHEVGYANLTYPYWRRDTEQLCAVP